MVKILSLTSDSINKHVEEKGGIYFIYCYNKNRPRKIGRTLKIDDKGLLFIGKAVNLQRRLKNFIRGIKEGKGHSGGARFRFYNLSNKRKLGNCLKFKVNYKCPPEHWEAKSLSEYWDKFGELPPLNAQEPARRWLRKLGLAE